MGTLPVPPRAPVATLFRVGPRPREIVRMPYARHVLARAIARVRRMRRTITATTSPRIIDPTAATTRSRTKSVTDVTTRQAIKMMFQRVQKTRTRLGTEGTDALLAAACEAGVRRFVACGAGWAAISLARAYPNITVDGFDLDETSIEIASRNAKEAGVADRVRFEVKDAADTALQSRYDLAMVVEAIHDLSQPVAVLSAIRGMLKPGGTLIVADERTEDSFTAPASETERLFYAYSVLCCLPSAMHDHTSAATGTVMRRTTFETYAKEAGFDGPGIEVCERSAASGSVVGLALAPGEVRFRVGGRLLTLAPGEVRLRVGGRLRALALGEVTLRGLLLAHP